MHVRIVRAASKFCKASNALSQVESGAGDQWIKSDEIAVFLVFSNRRNIESNWRSASLSVPP